MSMTPYNKLVIQTLSRSHILLFLTLAMTSCALSDIASLKAPAQALNQQQAPRQVSERPTLADYWAGNATFVVDVIDTGLPMGESDTVILPDGRYRSYVHASDRSLGVIDSCGEAVAFPGCVVLFESADSGRSFHPVRNDSGQVTCLIPCASCPCDSQRDHVDQQQYPRVVRLDANQQGEQWRMVYEYRGSVFLRTSVDGLNWSHAEQIPQTGVWRTWLMPCRAEESVGPHPFTEGEYECLVGAPPGLVIADSAQNDGRQELYVLVGTGQNPGAMGCYRGAFGGPAALLRKCEYNPLFTGASVYGDQTVTDSQANDYFDFRTISSADIVRVDDIYYMFYEGVRGPGPNDAGDAQFALGMARSLTSDVDGPWETFADNPILVDMPGNIGLGHADIVTDDGETVLYTSLDGERRSRLKLTWK